VTKHPEFLPPKAAIGQIVYWFNGAKDLTKPTAAIVTAVGTRNVSLRLIPPLTRDLKNVDGCRHLSDPDYTQYDREEGGFWDHTPDTKRLEEAMRILYDLQKPATPPNKAAS
jgi:hypothetical protein